MDVTLSTTQQESARTYPFNTKDFPRIVFHDTLTATIQQIGALMIPNGEESRIDGLSKKYALAGHGWERDIRDAPFSAFTLAERRDDYCAAAFVYCRAPQPVPKVDIKVATADIGRRDYEVA